MRWGTVSLSLLPVVSACSAGQPPEIREMAQRIVPTVRLADEHEFFAAWDLGRPGLEQVREAVSKGDLAAAKGSLKAYFLQRRHPRWRVNHWDMPAKPRGSPEQHSRFKGGEEVLAHRFSGGGHDVDFGDRIDWNYFPIRFEDGTPDTEYPLIHYINRFAHLSSTLGPLYWFSHDERYAKEFVYEVTDHVLSNPAPETYVRHTSVWSRLTSITPLCGSWLDAYNHFLPSASFTPEAHAVMLKGFIEKARYAARNPDSVNRYMAQLRGIFNCGAYFPELKQAEDFRAFAVQALAATVRDEFYPDGASRELCPGYHGGSAGTVRSVVTAARLMGQEVPSVLVDGLEGPYDFYLSVATPGRGIPAFGDTWSRGNLKRSYAAVVEVLDKPVYRWFATDGNEGTPPAFVCTRLPWAGFYAMRSGWDEDALYLCLDAGPLGVGHWHEDFGNFECYAYGERLISEVGIYSYTVNKWNQYFRSSLAHNVVLVDGLSQNRACELSTHAAAVAPRTGDWHDDDVFCLAWGEYTGKWGEYADNRGWRNGHGKDKAIDLARHRRDVCFVKGEYWIISDRLRAQGEHTYSQLFHFDPDRTVRAASPGSGGTADPERANVRLLQADPLPGLVIEGRDDPPQGWCSRKQGEVEPAPVLSFDQQATDVAVYDTLVLPRAPGAPEDATAVLRVPVTDEAGVPLSTTDVCALRITRPGGGDYYLNDLRQAEIGPGNGRTKRFAHIETDARAALVRMDGSGGLVKASAVGATALKVDGRDALPR